MSNTAVIIPSRLKAERLPNKPLKLINKKEMILHVYETAIKAKIGEVFVATPDREIADIIKSHGGKAAITNKSHQTGTDRIFEVFLKELKTEKSIIHAFDIGYSKAKITVLDANITTLIAAVILFAFGSGPVKGFAITLGIGIVSTLYSAYFLARHLTSMIVLNKKEGKVNL